MNQINWNEVKFRASSWGNLMTEPVTKADKEAGKLSLTCQKELLKIYAFEKYGRKTEILTKHMAKGVEAEESSITLFSRVEKTLYHKNEDQLENAFFCGHPDIFTGESISNAEIVWDIKTRWNMDSFLPKLMEEVDKAEELQLQVYFDLTGATSGGIANTLVSCPENLLMDEKRRLLYQMDVVSEESPAFLKAAAQLERNLTFDDIPIHERIIKQSVTRNEELIQKMKDKVPRLRNWLAEFDAKHSNTNKA
jgi:hypothetical protein